MAKESDDRLTVLDAAIARSLADAQASRVTPLDEAASRLLAKYRRLTEASGA